MSAKKPISPLPAWQIASAFAVQFSEAMNINVLFPFLAFMVESFGYGGPKLGYYAGGLAASFCGAQFLSAVFWGMISDRYGRRPAVILGSFGTGLGMLVFGLSRSYYQAIFGRFLSGLLCGNVGVLKSFVNEVTDETNRGAGFAMMSLSWACGTIVAPLVGGTLANPSDKYEIFKDFVLFIKFPFLLPCLVCVFFNISASVICYIVMKETRRVHAGNHGTKYSELSDSSQHPKQNEDLKDSNFLNVNLSGDIEMSLIQVKVEPLDQPQPFSPNDSLTQMEVDSSTRENNEYNCVLHRILPENDDIESNSDKLPEDSENTISFGDIDESNLGTLKDGLQSNINPGEESDEDDEHVLAWYDERYSKKHSKNKLEKGGRRPIPLFFRRNVIIATGSYGLLCMSYILLDETLPLFLKLDRKMGGLAFGSNDIGFLLSTSGVFMLFFTSTVLPMLTTMKKSRLFFLASVFAIPTVFAWPLIAILDSRVLIHLNNFGKHILWALLIMTASFKNVFACMAFTAVMLQVNDSCGSRHLGAVNGLGQSLGALARSIGPAIGGMLWSLSIMNRFIFTNFIGVAVLITVCQTLNFFLPESQKRPMGKDGEQEIVFNEM